MIQSETSKNPDKKQQKDTKSIKKLMKRVINQRLLQAGLVIYPLHPRIDAVIAPLEEPWRPYPKMVTWLRGHPHVG